MKRELRVTSDGSKTLYIRQFDEFYHSVHGALNESMHVFINNGLNAVDAHQLSILEFGMGTGLNALLTYGIANDSKREIEYTTLEKYPLSKDEWSLVEYGDSELEKVAFEEIHNAEWNQKVELSPYFILNKIETAFEEFEPEENSFDLIYYDAFAPSAQPELWDVPIFKLCLKALKPGGFLVTYCANGQAKRNMKAAGFIVKALPGPPKKREMTKATKPLL